MLTSNPKSRQSLVDEIPGMKRLNSFGSDSSSSSGEHTGKHRIGRNEFTEAAAHRLRRQRLAKSPSLLINSAPNYTTRACSPQLKSLVAEVAPFPARSIQSTRQPQKKLMNSKVYSPKDPSALSRPRHGGSNSNKPKKHVAFSEPVPLLRTRPGSDFISDAAPINIGNFDCLPLKVKSCYASGVDAMGYHTSENSLCSRQSDEDTSIFADVTKNTNTDKTLEQLEKSWISYLDEEEIFPNLHSVTVRKRSKNEKIGIYVHFYPFDYGDRLVVSDISPTGKFANSGIEVGDIVVSINGENMLEDPKTQKAVDIVTTATDSVTIVVQKDLESDDTQSATQTSISTLSKDVSSIAHKKLHSLTLDDCAQKSNRKKGEEKSTKNKVRKREEMTGDGSMLISKDTKIKGPVSITMNESWKLSGAIVVSIEKLYASENPGIHMGIKESTSGHVLYISEMSPSSLFARTPLRTGDIILSINNVSLYDNADLVDAYSALGRPGNRITLVARKGGESLNDFLLEGRRQPVIKKEIVPSGQESIDSPLTSKTAGTVGTTISGNSGRDRSNDSGDLFEDGMIGFKASEIWKSYSQHDAADNVSKAVSSLSRGSNEFDFDEESYGASLFGYNSSSSVTIVKNSSNEDIGVEMMEITTEWGRLLVVSKITPRSLTSDTDLKVGDAILAINRISFRKNPSTARASSLVRNAQREVRIEYQKLSSFSPAVPVGVEITKPQKSEVLKAKSSNSYEPSSESTRKPGQVFLTLEEGGGLRRLRPWTAPLQVVNKEKVDIIRRKGSRTLQLNFKNYG